MIAIMILLGILLGQQATGFNALLKKLQTLPPARRNAVVTATLKQKRLPMIDGDSLLTFVWYGRADSVAVNGSLQGGWRSPEKLERLPCGKDSALFYKQYVVPADASLEYQFIVNGKYGLDPGNVRTTPDGDFRNSQAVMPKFRPTPWTTVNPSVPHGTVDTILFTPLDAGLRPRTIYVYRPHGAVPKDGYGLAVIHDGETALRFLGLTTIADNMIAAGEVPPFIAVFVPPGDRVHEYRGALEVRYMYALADGLVPLIEQRYRTARDPFRRACLGISDGGHCALLAPLIRGDVFGLCAGQSSTIDQDLLDRLAACQAATPMPPQTRIYHQVGRFDIVSDEFDFPQQNRAFAALLARTGIQHRFVESHDGHEWPAWRERVPEILRFLFKPH